MRIPIRVEASRDGKSYLELSDSDGRPLSEWLSLQGYELGEVS
jgi:hypothetical protein